MNSKKTIYILILILTIGIVGLTIAYFANSSTITNTFNTNPYGTTVTEEFVSPDNWLPGTSTDKSLTVTNTGQVDEAVRISYTESWTSRSAKDNNEEGDLPLQQNGNTAALIHFINTDDWTTVTENGITYRYYNYKLEPNQTTSELLDYVTFNPAITNSSNCIETPTATGKTITCNSTGEGYDDATYKLTFNIETIQYDKYKTAWGTNVNIASMKPMNATQLALKSNPVSVTNYTDGNVHEMYTFNHDATEQTPFITTDYRYIGNDPYNYVYFNCDSLDNQNSDTCEVWRIIGVFDVERTDPNDNTKTITERRMKLVRGSALSERMAWDSNYTNDWSNSSLNTFLNGEYLNNIANSSKGMIEQVKYYLGGIISEYYQYSGHPYYGAPEDIYKWERGTEIFNYENYCINNPSYYKCTNENYCENNPSDAICTATRNTSWVGEVALMYPSDMYMTYAKGVNITCYNDPEQCYNGIPTLSWIHITNILQDGLSPENTWYVSPASDDSQYVFFAPNGGGYNRSSSWHNFAVRPVLYLSSSVNIIDGDGSINNPYKLSL